MDGSEAKAQRARLREKEQRLVRKLGVPSLARSQKKWLVTIAGVKAKKNPEPELFCVCGRGSCPVAWTHSQGQKNKQTNI